MQVYDQVQLPVPVEIACPDNFEVRTVDEAVHRVQHLCSAVDSQDDLGVGQIRIALGPSRNSSRAEPHAR